MDRVPFQAGISFWSFILPLKLATEKALFLSKPGLSGLSTPDQHIITNGAPPDNLHDGGGHHGHAHIEHAHADLIALIALEHRVGSTLGDGAHQSTGAANDAGRSSGENNDLRADPSVGACGQQQR